MSSENRIREGLDAFATQLPEADMEKDRIIKLNALKGLEARSKELGIRDVEFEESEWILHEGKPNDRLFVITEGEAELLKRSPTGQKIQVDRLRTGNFLGLISFWTERKSFSSSRALSHLKCVYMERERFRNLMDQDREFNRIMQDLIISNLTQRYQRMALLNVEVARLTHDLETERNSLKSTIFDLELTRNRLIHQEKLATMGQLVAGIAHEINNPSSALIKSVGTLETEIPRLFHKNGPLSKCKIEKELLDQGIASPFFPSDVVRNRMDALEERYSNLKRSMNRRLAQLNDEGMQLIQKALHEANKKNQWNELDSLISFFEIGIYIRGIRTSVHRITGLVKSLKNYGRTDSLELSHIDLKSCIDDTLVVLNNRLKEYDVKVNCGPLPEVECHPGEINQVITNILLNACEASQVTGEITIENGFDEKEIWIAISDRGHGIPENLLKTIFHTNVTTKNKSGEFGLGIGLSISRDIIHKHGGRILAENRKHGGARFAFYLPISD